MQSDDTIHIMRNKTSQARLPALWGAQIRAARALLNWSAEELARHSALGLATIRRAEGHEKETALTAANDLAIRRTLEAAGVEFIADENGGPGVRFRTSVRYK
jgi:hypothetical protein